MPTRESAVLREVEYCLSHYGFRVLPRGTRASPDPAWSVWNDIGIDEGYLGVIWRSNTGALKTGGRFIRFGIAGLPDFQGWLYTQGRRVSLEVKAPGKGYSVDQKAHAALALKTGCLHGVVDSYESCEVLLKSWGLRRCSN